MSLRVRLIVAFVIFSVVPLGAMTWFSYSNSARALQDAAEQESDMLAEELSQRMQLITDQLSERMGRLADADAEMSVAAAPSIPPRTAAAPAQVQVQARPEAPREGPPSTADALSIAGATQGWPSALAQSALEALIADRLGDAAMYLNNVEFRGLVPPPLPNRRPGGRGPDQSVQGTGTGVATRGRSANANGTANGTANASAAGSADGAGNANGPRRGGRRGGPPPTTSRGSAGAAAQPTPAPAPTAAIAPSPGPSPAPSAPPPPGAAPPPPNSVNGVNAAESDNGDRVRIDLSAIRRDMFREISPEKPFQEMNAAERQRVIAELNQRMLGIQQGLKIGAAELQKKADEAKREAQPPPAAPAAPREQAGAPPPAISSSAAPAQMSAVAAGSAATASVVVKRPALTGNQLNVRRERNGVVRQVNAEVNLADLLSSVFTATPRSRGEVPFAIDKTARLYTPTAEDRKVVEALGPSVSNPAQTVGATRLPEWIVVTTADPSGSGLKFGIARPVGEALKEIRRTAVRSAGLGLLFIGIALLAVVPLSAGLTRNLSRLNAGVHRLAGGDYRARVSVSTQDEVGQLALAFNQMAEDVERHQAAAVGQERIRRELELGRKIQHDMLPGGPLVVGTLEVQGVSTPAGEVGGDFYNYMRLPDGKVAILIGDVSGKGVGAALLMSNIQASLRTRLSLGQGLTAVADELDRDIEANTPGPVYSTLFVGILDPAGGWLRYVNAGHNPQYLVRLGGRLERLAASGLPIGLLAGRGYQEGVIQLEPGDTVFCFTDGCVELENDEGEMFGAESLEHELLAAASLSTDALLRRMDARLRAFRGQREPADDLTMMAAKIG